MITNYFPTNLLRIACLSTQFINFDSGESSLKTNAVSFWSGFDQVSVIKKHKL